MNTEELKQLAIDSTMSGTSMQEGVREVLDEVFGLDTVVEAVEMYRNEMEDVWVANAGDDQIPRRRKIVNNVINDISRIARGKVGRSIVCVKRTYPFKYDSVEPKPKAAPEPKPTPEPATVSGTMGMVDWPMIRQACGDDPQGIIQRLFDETADIDELGRMFLDELKARKAAVSL